MDSNHRCSITTYRIYSAAPSTSSATYPYDSKNRGDAPCPVSDIGQDTTQHARVSARTAIRYAFRPTSRKSDSQSYTARPVPCLSAPTGTPECACRYGHRFPLHIHYTPKQLNRQYPKSRFFGFRPLFRSPSFRGRDLLGFRSRTRTCACGSQSPVPYRLGYPEI